MRFNKGSLKILRALFGEEENNSQLKTPVAYLKAMDEREMVNYD